MGQRPDSQPGKSCRDMRMSETRYTGLGQVRAQGQRVWRPEGQAYGRSRLLPSYTAADHTSHPRSSYGEPAETVLSSEHGPWLGRGGPNPQPQVTGPREQDACGTAV